MAWSKLGYVKTTPALAVPKLVSGTQDINIWDIGGGQFNFSTSVIDYNGLRFGEVLYVPSDMGYMYAPNILAVTGPDKDNYFIGALSEMHSVGMGFDPTKDIYMALVEWHAPELGLGTIRSIFFCSALGTDAGNINDTVEGINNVQGFGITPVIDELHAIFRIAHKVDLNTANLPIPFLYERFNPEQATWMNDFGGTSGFGIDTFDYPDANLKWRTSHGTCDGSTSYSENNSSFGTSDILVDEEWVFEFDYDMTRCVAATDWNEVDQPIQPMGMFAPVSVQLGGGGSREVAVVIVANNNGTFRGLPIAYTDGPASLDVKTFQGTGRIKIYHDGSQNYNFYVSYDHGITWETLWTGIAGNKGEIPGYETLEKKILLRGSCSEATDEVDIRWTGLDLRTYQTTPAFVPLQTGEYPVNQIAYLCDRLGFSDGVNNYKGFDGSSLVFDGSNTGTVIPPDAIFDESRYNGQAAYRINAGIHGDVFHFDGVEDAYGMLVSGDFGSGMIYITFAVKDSQRTEFTNYITGVGGTVQEIGKLFTANGAGSDYTWVWVPPTPPTPSISGEGMPIVGSIDVDILDDFMLELE